MNIPKDPMMLLSYINTQLRDHYSSLDELCKSLSLDKEQIVSSLESLDYHYDPSLNKFL